MNELCDLGAADARRLIGAREISPVELLDSCLGRISAVNPAVNALVTLCEERAWAEAQAAERAVLAGDELGLLHGLPIGIKDLQETADVRTTFGSPIFADNVPLRDERLVAAIRQAGGIVLGKTNTPEFGAGANTVNPVFGATRNPFDTRLTCGGSSGGSAVALATGMLPLCTGSDTGGSLRVPAAFCGVVGYRPSPGLIPSERRPLGWTPITVQGPMARSTEDVRLLLRAMTSADSRDPLAGRASQWSTSGEDEADLSRLRIALSDDLGGAPLDVPIRETFHARVQSLASVVRSCDWTSLDLSSADRAFAVTRAQNFLAAYGEHYERRRDQLGRYVVANYEEGLAMTAADVAQAHVAATRLYRTLEALFEEVDLLISPTVGVAPFPIEQGYAQRVGGRDLPTYYAWLAPTYYLSLTGQPCLALPCGLAPGGTPFSLQLCARAGADRFLLAAAQALERHLARDPVTARPSPDLDRLRIPA